MRLEYASVLISVLCGCSAVHSVYQQTGYDVHAAHPVKHIAVAAWASQDVTGLGEVVTQVAADLIKLRKNYLVHETGTLKQAWPELCGEKIEGVFAVRALESSMQANKVSMRIAAELYRCHDGALLWRADAGDTVAADDANLAMLTANYARSVSPAARSYAAPAFVILQQIIAALPDPTLTDADIEEKIELGLQPATMLGGFAANL